MAKLFCFMLISCFMQIFSIASSVCSPATCLQTQSMAAYSIVIMNNTSSVLSIESGPIMQDCLDN